MTEKEEECVWQYVGAISIIIGICLLVIFGVWSLLVIGEALTEEMGLLGTIGVYGLAFSIVGAYLFNLGQRMADKKTKFKESTVKKK